MKTVTTWVLSAAVVCLASIDSAQAQSSKPSRTPAGENTPAKTTEPAKPGPAQTPGPATDPIRDPGAVDSAPGQSSETVPSSGQTIKDQMELVQTFTCPADINLDVDKDSLGSPKQIWTPSIGWPPAKFLEASIETPYVGADYNLRCDYVFKYGTVTESSPYPITVPAKIILRKPRPYNAKATFQVHCKQVNATTFKCANKSLNDPTW